MPLLRTCCCFLATRTGSLFLGVVSLIRSILYVVYSSLVLCGLLDWGKPLPSHQSGPLVVTQIILAMHCFDLAASIILIIAASMKCRFLLLPWTTMTASYLIMCISFLILGISAGISTTSLALFVLDVLLQMYFILVVLSYYQELRDGIYVVKFGRDSPNFQPD